MVSPLLKDLYPPSPDAPGPHLVWSAVGFGNAASDWSSLSTVDINGVSFTIDNNGKWATFGPDSSGRLQWSISSDFTYGNGNFNSPIVRASLADILGETPSKTDTYIWRMVFASDSADPASSDGGVGLGIRTEQGGAGKDVGALWKRDDGDTTNLVRFPNTSNDHGSGVNGVRSLSVELIQSFAYFTRYATAESDSPRAGTAAHRGVADTAVQTATPSSNHLDITDSAECWVSGWGGSTPSTFLIADLQLWRESPIE